MFLDGARADTEGDRDVRRCPAVEQVGKNLPLPAGQRVRRLKKRDGGDGFARKEAAAGNLEMSAQGGEHRALFIIDEMFVVDRQGRLVVATEKETIDELVTGSGEVARRMDGLYRKRVAGFVPVGVSDSDRGRQVFDRKDDHLIAGCGGMDLES